MPRLSDGILTLTMHGASGQSYVIEASFDLVHWFEFTTLVPENEHATFGLPLEDDQPQLFLRVVLGES